MKLYYAPGACSLAPHIALREAGADFSLVRINTREGEQRTPEFLNINPRGRVPVLEHGGEAFTEATAMLVFLGASFPKADLLPELSSAEGLRCLEWLSWLSSSLHGAFMQQWRPERFLPFPEPQDLVDFGLTLAERMVGEIESRSTGPWLLGERYSLADIYAFVFYGWGNRAGLGMATLCPRWTDQIMQMMERPAVLSAIAAEEIAGNLYPSPAVGEGRA